MFMLPMLSLCYFNAVAHVDVVAVVFVVVSCDGVVAGHVDNRCCYLYFCADIGSVAGICGSDIDARVVVYYATVVVATFYVVAGGVVVVDCVYVVIANVDVCFVTVVAVFVVVPCTVVVTAAVVVSVTDGTYTIIVTVIAVACVVVVYGSRCRCGSWSHGCCLCCC